ncbi:thiol:disulfide interchange protein [bacterium]|nr:thiol:disulfide interchange protein [bacterium]
MLQSFRLVFPVLLAAALATITLPLGAEVVERDHIRVELVAAQTAAVPGQPLTVALRLEPDKHWHTYWINPGDSGLPTKIQWSLPAGASVGELQFPFPERQSLGPLTNYGYSGEHFLLADITPPADFAGNTFTVNAEASWLVCDDVCIPGDAPLALSLPVAQNAKPSRWAAKLEQAAARVPKQRMLPAQFEIADGALRLQADAADFAGASVKFFPETQEVVNNAAPITERQQGSLVEFNQALSDYYDAPPDELAVVFVIDGKRAIRALAQPAIAGQMVDLSAAAPVGASAADSDGGMTLLLAVGLALLGGLILNLMPCVFPVLSIKAIAVAQSSGQSAGHRRLHALVYTAGVVLGFVALAVGLLALRAGGEAAGWGFQLQSPWVVGALAYVMFLLGLALHGYWSFGTRLMGVGQNLTEQDGARGAFFTGLLACVVATPCTAPFMGAAMGYAVTRPAFEALTVFAALGVGMAIPFLLLGFVPALARALPRPGPWMDSFKKLMAFPLYLTAIWLVWVLGRQVGVNGMAALLVGLLALVCAVGLWARAGKSAWVQLGRVAGLGLAALAIALLASPLMQTAPAQAQATATSNTPVASEAYTPARLDQLLATGQPVFVNLTADWCVTCHVNERVAIGTNAVQTAMSDAGITYLKGDWTNRDPEITALLEKYQRSGVPLYLLYSGRSGEAPTVLPQILTPGIVVDAIDELSL